MEHKCKKVHTFTLVSEDNAFNMSIYISTPSRNMFSSKYSSCSCNKIGLFRIGLNLNALIPNARKNRNAAGKTLSS